MVGNLKATFTKEGLYELSEKILPYLIELRKKLNLNYILLENLILKSVKSLYKYEWIKFTGWVRI